jgi:hypothetical protein
VTELFKFQNMKLKFRPNHGPSPMVVPPRYSKPRFSKNWKKKESGE